MICQAQLVRDGLVHLSPQLLEEIQRELRAVKAEGAIAALTHAPSSAPVL